MATPRPIASYPREYFLLFMQALKEPKVVPIPADKQKERTNFRNQLYAFRIALLRAEESGKLDPQNPLHQGALDAAFKITFEFANDGILVRSK